jgi:hypothetical protein
VASPASISCSNNCTVTKSESASVTGMSNDSLHLGISLSFTTAVMNYSTHRHGHGHRQRHKYIRSTHLHACASSCVHGC